MGDLNHIVVNRIQTYWQDVAFAMNYDIHVVDSILGKHNGNPRLCCQEFLKDWLITDHGSRSGPKTWATLLNALVKVDMLVAARENIMTDLAKFK